MNRALARVDVLRSGVDGRGCERVAGQRAPYRVAAFVVVFVPADDEIYAKAVEQGKPVLPDGEICTVGAVTRRDGGLVHTHDHPVDVCVGARALQFAFEPALLSAPRVAPHVRIATVLVA